MSHEMFNLRYASPETLEVMVVGAGLSSLVVVGAVAFLI